MKGLVKLRKYLLVSNEIIINATFLELQNQFDGEVATRIEREKDIL